MSDEIHRLAAASRAGAPDAASDLVARMDAALGQGGASDETLAIASALVGALEAELPPPVRFEVATSLGVHAFHSADHDAAREWFDVARAEAEAVGDPSFLARALHNVGMERSVRGEWEEAAETLLEALDLKIQAGDTADAAQVLVMLAGLMMDQDDRELARGALDLAGEIARETSALAVLAAVQDSRGRLLAIDGEFEAAEQHFRQAVQTARRAGSPRDELVAILNLTRALREQGRSGLAIRWARKAVRLGERWREPGLAAHSLASLASALVDSDRIDEAKAAIRAALDQVRDDAHRAELLGQLAQLEHHAGNIETAYALLQQCRDVARDAGHRDIEARALVSIGMLSLGEGDPEGGKAAIEEAVDRAEDPELALSIARDAFTAACGLLGYAGARGILEVLVEAGRRSDRLDVRYDTAGAAGALALEYGAFDDATLFLFHALEAAERLDDPLRRFAAHNDCGIAFSEWGHLDQAIAQFETCLEIARDLGDDETLHQALANLGEALRRTGDLERASELLHEALPLARELGAAPHSQTSSLVGLLRLDQSRPEDAKAAFGEALILAEEAGQSDARAAALSGLAHCAFDEGALELAAGLYLGVARERQTAGHADEMGHLGNAVQALAMLADERLSDVVQRLVGVAQSRDAEQWASETLMGAGYGALTKGHTEAAASLCALGVVLALVRRTQPPEELGEEFGGLVAGAVLLADDQPPERLHAFTEHLTRALASYLPDMEEMLSPLIAEAADVALASEPA